MKNHPKIIDETDYPTVGFKPMLPAAEQKEIAQLENELALWKNYAICYTEIVGRCDKCRTPLNKGYVCCSCRDDDNDIYYLIEEQIRNL